MLRGGRCDGIERVGTFSEFIRDRRAGLAADRVLSILGLAGARLEFGFSPRDGLFLDAVYDFDGIGTGIELRDTHFGTS